MADRNVPSQSLRVWGPLQTPVQRGRLGYRSPHLYKPLTAPSFKHVVLTFATIQLEKTYTLRHFWRINSIAFVRRSSSHPIAYQPRHANFLAFYHSYQARFDYWMMTNNLDLTRPLALKLDAFLRDILSTTAGFDIFELPPEDTPLLSFTEARVSLKLKNSGLGRRPYEHRYLLLNSLNNILPQAIDRLD